MTDYGVPSSYTFRPLTFVVIYLLQPALTTAKNELQWYYCGPISLYSNCSRTPFRCGLTVALM